jgi:hypothetical protein
LLAGLFVVWDLIFCFRDDLDDRGPKDVDVTNDSGFSEQSSKHGSRDTIHRTVFAVRSFSFHFF